MNFIELSVIKCVIKLANLQVKIFNKNAHWYANNLFQNKIFKTRSVKKRKFARQELSKMTNVYDPPGPSVGTAVWTKKSVTDASRAE